MRQLVYGLIDGDMLELRYVGRSVDPERRVQKGYADLKLRTWLQETNWNIVILERSENAAEAERRWICTMLEQGARLFNHQIGGGATPGYKHTPEARARMSLAQLGNQKGRGYHLTPEHRDILRARMNGNQLGRTSFLGRRHSEETRAKMRTAWAIRRARFQAQKRGV